MSRWKDAHPGGCERHLAVFDRHRILPKYCFDCYKIPVEPRTVMELLKLLMIFEKLHFPATTAANACAKRGCSEYAQVYPGYARIKLGAALMQYNDDWQVHEDSFDGNAGFGAVDVSREHDGNQTAYSPEEIFAMRYWLRYAATIGDASYLKIAGCTLPSLPRLRRPPFAAPRPI